MRETCLHSILEDREECAECNPEFNKNCPRYVIYSVTTRDEIYGNVNLKENLEEIYQE